MNLEIDIELNRFQARPYQIPIFDAIENLGYKKVIAIMPRRCLSANAQIIMANGSWKYLKEIKPGEKILSWNPVTGIEQDIVRDIWKTGVKKSLKVKSTLNPALLSSRDHNFAYEEITRKFKSIKWLRLEEINKRKNLLAYPGCLETRTSNPDLAELVGYLQCDGYISEYQQPKFTNTNITILKRVEELLLKLFSYQVIWRKKGNGYDLGITNGTRGGGTFKNEIKELFRAEHQDVPKSKKRFLSFLWDLNETSIGRFLAAVISADGNIYCHKERTFKNKTLPQTVEITINAGKSEGLCLDYYWMFRKFGITPHIPYLEKGSNWKIKIGRSDNIKKLLSYGRIYGKEEAQAKALEVVKNPIEAHRTLFSLWTNKFNTEDGPEIETYDLETENNNNFFANGYLVHNSGKDLAAFNLMFRQALRRVGTYFYVLPTFSSGRRIIWDNITITGERLLDYIPPELIESKNEQQMRIKFINGSIMQIIGSDTYDNTIVGTNPIGMVFSEFAITDPRAYYLSRPILNANNGWVLLVSTPRGHNAFYDLWTIAKANPSEWFCHHQTIDQTGHISITEIKKEIASGEISEDLALQEYWCSFEAGQIGSYYSSYLDKARTESRITMVPYEPSFKVHTAWDLGVHDATCIIFFQLIGGSIRIIDCYTNTDKGLDHYAKILDQKDYKFGEHVAPHDIAVRELGANAAMSRLETAHNLGIDFIIAPNISIEDGIEAVRSTFNKFYFDEQKTKPLIKALEMYRREWDDKRQTYKNRPLHDVNSNFADATRMLAVSLPKISDSVTTPEELDRRYRSAMIGAPLPYQFDDNKSYY